MGWSRYYIELLAPSHVLTYSMCSWLHTANNSKQRPLNLTSFHILVFADEAETHVNSRTMLTQQSELITDKICPPFRG